MTLRQAWGRIDVSDRVTRRLVLLYGGLVIGGVGFSMFVVADLGLDPWDVLHQGISMNTGLSLGTVVILIGLAALLLWIPLRQRPGLGTLSDVIVVGLVIDASLAILPRPGGIGPRVAILIGALVLNGLAISMYIGARMGAGPRDGLMMGLAAKGLSIRRSRIVIDLTVVGFGWLLGGTVGVGTIASVVTIGPIVHYFLPRFTVGSSTDAQPYGSPVRPNPRSPGKSGMGSKTASTSLCRQLSLALRPLPRFRHPVGPPTRSSGEVVVKNPQCVIVL